MLEIAILKSCFGLYGVGNGFVHGASEKTKKDLFFLVSSSLTHSGLTDKNYHGLPSLPRRQLVENVQKVLHHHLQQLQQNAERNQGQRRQRVRKLQELQQLQLLAVAAGMGKMI